ncbi:MAG: type II toxin-antitoxin system RelE/ParE family toxin [Azoarcus sp.]|jgi:putative addiction module killer protein|nr:type II toxin-antitoxin system RelE/ParE family toxin [Azoarcus sp.]
MFEIIKSDEFMTWVAGLRDRMAATRIAARLDNAANGNLGDWKALRGGISEIRINVGKGYRLYFTRRGNTVIVLLCGGDKSTQKRDIERAIELCRTWED